LKEAEERHAQELKEPTLSLGPREEC
jgi:hypothetical protein